MDMAQIATGGFSALMALSTIVGTRVSLRQIKREDEKKAVELALMGKSVQLLETSNCHAHDKIRDLCEKNNSLAVSLGEFRVTMQESNRVMQQVERALLDFARIEERINGHIEAERGDR